MYSGELRRQRETATNVVKALDTEVQLQFDPRWNEFDLDDVYRKIAPQIAAVDETFRVGYEQMMATVHDPDAMMHRAHSSLDVTVVRAWIANQFSYDGESFVAFAERIHAALESLKGSTGPVAVFTSATPTGLAIAAALGLPIHQSMKLAGVTYNSSISTLRIHPQGNTLFSFNGVPHLAESRLRTFR